MNLTDFVVDNCRFPSDCLYDLENLVWVKLVKESNLGSDGLKEVLIGITPVYTYMAGRINKLKVKPIGSLIQRNKSIGSIESLVHFGTVRSPIEGEIKEINSDAVENPKIINDSPFGNGWMARIVTSDDPVSNRSLKKLEDCKEELLVQIKKYNVKCFKLFPDFQVFEIGTECSTTLAKLGEMMNKSVKKGQVIRLVSDDPTADLELLRWAEHNKHEIIEIVKERNSVSSSANSYLFNIIIKKRGV
ncbi:hypothetical protein [Candidatus Nitrosocosmicus franklandus]|uniref:Glycine cleavage system H protein n=1 Tax=Candidatus Nitrosocosmicus franklandianus TaxID=1798806 RepID=A0A484IBC3_9ARCH|nr:hypothetical protein [Candidatus Nitrosocosmicus franklandus]VFJ12980.1 Glycine cleavage system H protein [Candidatus Nitrosocosmicus franklandus]